MDLRELYQEIIIDHNRNPRNHHALHDANASANGFNPLCGDKLTVYLKLTNQTIEKISFVGCGCAISQASASLMTEELTGKSINVAHQLFNLFHQLITTDNENDWTPLNKLNVFAGVKSYPARAKCATLAWHTLEAALNRETVAVSTE